MVIRRLSSVSTGHFVIQQNKRPLHVVPEGVLNSYDYVKKSLCQTRHLRSEFADYAVDSVFFALGLTDSVSEPSDHGFDPAAEDW